MVDPVAETSTTPMSTLDFRPILRELTDSAMEVRRSLRAAILAVLPPGTDFTSRRIADVLGLDKTSGWRCVRVATIADVAGILGSLPRGRGWSKILEALERTGCPDDALASLRAAVDGLHDRIVRRGISQAMLEVIAAGELDDAARKIVLRRIRQQHFESTLLVLGVSARTRMGATIVAPAQGGDVADVVGVTLVDGLERHRDGPPWNIHVGFTPLRRGRRDAEADTAEASPFLPAWSTPDTLGEEVVAEHVEGRWRFDFVSRRPDDPDPIRVALCESIRGTGPLRTDDPDKLVTFAMPHGLPVQSTVFDLLLHRSIEPSAIPYAALYATIDRDANGSARSDWPETTRLPLDAATTEIDDPDLPEPLEDLSQTWRELLEHGADLLERSPDRSLDRALDEFRIHRTFIPHPPVPATVVVRWGLPGDGA